MSAGNVRCYSKEEILNVTPLPESSESRSYLYSFHGGESKGESVWALEIETQDPDSYTVGEEYNFYIGAGS